MGVGQQDTGKNRQHEPGSENWDALKDDVSEMAGAAVERGRHFVETARGQATDYADRRKGDIAQSVADFAMSLRESTSSFDDRPNIRAVVDSAAEGLDHLADSIRARSFADMFNDFEDMTRRHPATVAAVSVAVGFLTARFIKSTAEDLRENRSDSEGRQAGRVAGSRSGQGSRVRTSA